MKPEEIRQIVNEIGSFYGKPYPPQQIASWLDMFSSETLTTFKGAWTRYQQTAETERRPTHAQIRRLCDEVRVETREFGSDTQVNPEFILSEQEKDECSAAAEFLNEVLTWHRMHLVERKASTVKASDFDMDKWRHAGKPELWSPILDHAYGGLSEIWHEAHSAKAAFYRKYTETLVRKRLSRAVDEHKTENNDPQTLSELL